MNAIEQHKQARQKKRPSESEIARICLQYEFESDEYMTRRDKAIQVILGGHIPPRY